MGITRQLTLLAGLGAAALAEAETYGVGAIALPRPALSVQVRPDASYAWHVAAYYDATSIEADVDHQRLMRVAGLSGPRSDTSLYAGLGLRGSSHRNDHAAERYSLRIPAGLQAQLRPLGVSLFAEAAALLGELPATRLGATYSGGVRATF